MDLRGRSRPLRINDRSSHQIRGLADQLLDPESRDVDGNVRVRRGDGLTPREFAIFVPSEAGKLRL